MNVYVERTTSLRLVYQNIRQNVNFLKSVEKNGQKKGKKLKKKLQNTFQKTRFFLIFRKISLKIQITLLW